MATPIDDLSVLQSSLRPQGENTSLSLEGTPFFLPLEIIARVGLQLTSSATNKFSMTCKAGQTAIPAFEAVCRMEWREKMRKFLAEAEKWCTNPESKEKLNSCISRISTIIDALILETAEEVKNSISFEIVQFIFSIPANERAALEANLGVLFDDLIGEKLLPILQKAFVKSHRPGNFLQIVEIFSKYGIFNQLLNPPKGKRSSESDLLYDGIVSTAEKLIQQKRLNEAIELCNILVYWENEIFHIVDQIAKQKHTDSIGLRYFHQEADLTRFIMTKIGVAIATQNLSSDEICEIVSMISSNRGRYHFILEILRHLIRLDDWTKVATLNSRISNPGNPLLVNYRNIMNIFILSHNCKALCKKLQFKNAMDQVNAMPDGMKEKSEMRWSVIFWTIWFSIQHLFFIISCCVNNPFSSADFELSF